MNRFLKLDTEQSRSSGFTKNLWLSNLSAGKANKHVIRKDREKQKRWAEATVFERAEQLTRALGHRKQPRIHSKMPKLCPRGVAPIAVLNDVQAVAPKLMSPESNIKRLILQIPPGAENVHIPWSNGSIRR